MTIKRTLSSNARFIRKSLNWLFKGKSLASHITFLIFAYFSLKYLLFPSFLWVMGFNDVVAVISGSMHHQPGSIDTTFIGWLNFNDFNESDYSNWPYIHGLDMGDAVTVVPGNIFIGDVIIYYHGSEMIIHRVVRITIVNGTNYYTTKGDANPESMVFESMIPEYKVIGKAGNRFPWIGWPRTAMYYLIGV